MDANVLQKGPEAFARYARKTGQGRVIA
jgi:hypothetical protein